MDVMIFTRITLQMKKLTQKVEGTSSESCSRSASEVKPNDKHTTPCLFNI